MSTLNIVLFIEIRKDIPNVSSFAFDLALWWTLSGSNYPCLEQIDMTQKWESH